MYFLYHTLASLNPITNLSPINSLLLLILGLAVLFLFLVSFLDANENFALKNDWRKNTKATDKEPPKDP